jgi:hypothetical protein
MSRRTRRIRKLAIQYLSTHTDRAPDALATASRIVAPYRARQIERVRQREATAAQRIRDTRHA